MTLDEAIKHCEEIAVKCNTVSPDMYRKCGEEHRQLAEWLKELRDRRLAEKGGAI